MTENKKIIRVQNLRLWRKCDAHKRVVRKNNRKVNEKGLFHGTRGNDPTLIYEDGFEMRLSAQAASAVYADGFAHSMHRIWSQGNFSYQGGNWQQLLSQTQHLKDHQS